MNTPTNGSQPKPKCFVIMPISDPHGYEAGHFGRVYEHLLKPAIVQAGFSPVRADDAVKTDFIVIGIIQQIVDSEMVVCDFSARNPNVLYELGVRHAFNKPVVLLKDRRTEKIFDIQGLRHTEYDETLRIDSVQKDIAKVAASILETSTAPLDTVNSVVRLAGIKTAEAPIEQTVSADTSLILQGIGSIEKRLIAIETDRQGERYFHFIGDKVVLGEKETVALGTEIFDSNFDSLGELVDLHPADNRLFIKAKSGKVTPFHAYSVRSKGLTALPF